MIVEQNSKEDLLTSKPQKSILFSERLSNLSRNLFDLNTLFNKLYVINHIDTI